VKDLLSGPTVLRNSPLYPSQLNLKFNQIKIRKEIEQLEIYYKTLIRELKECATIPKLRWPRYRRVRRGCRRYDPATSESRRRRATSWRRQSAPPPPQPRPRPPSPARRRCPFSNRRLDNHTRRE